MRPTRKTNNHKCHPRKASMGEVRDAFDLLASITLLVACEYLSNDREDEYDEVMKANDVLRRFIDGQLPSKDIDKNDAPKGYYAGPITFCCDGCAFEHENTTIICTERKCIAENRADKCDVIFKKRN